jgi:hypothetical protein
MQDDRPELADEPLPQTLRFVTGLGIFIFLAWWAMFALLSARW